MGNNLNRALIETTIRNSIRQIKNDPERSMRNLIDMALSFSNGRFQKLFLEAAQTMLRNENSCYYKIIPDLVANADMERIVTFGMNIGYNSCTLGAQTIRELEVKEKFNIPWSIYIELESNSYNENEKHYRSLLFEGKKMGIYTWNIHTTDDPTRILKLASEFPECAFSIFCASENITQTLLDEARDIHNILFCVEYGDNSEEACSLLRSQGFLYSIYYTYQTSSLNADKLDEILSDTENQNAVFTLLLSQPTQSQSESSEMIYQCIKQTRSEQKYRTVPFDLIHDNCFIDSIISDQICSIKFASDGTCHSLIDNRIYENCNVFHHSLHDILKTVCSSDRLSSSYLS